MQHYSICNACSGWGTVRSPKFRVYAIEYRCDRCNGTGVILHPVGVRACIEDGWRITPTPPENNDG